MSDRDDTCSVQHSEPGRDQGGVEAGVAAAMTPDTPFRSQLAACTRFALHSPRRIALFLDMDGTLLDLAATPESVTVPGGLVPLLQRLADGLDGALAIVTGRRINEVDTILAPLRVAASGVHGSELRSVATGAIERMTPDLSEHVVLTLQVLARQTPGAFAEPKGSGLAIHYRLVPEAESSIAEQLQRFHKENPGKFDIWPGRKVFEVLPKGFTKGTAISTLASITPFKDRTPVMIGDDVGDEPAFAVAEKLGGFGLRVAGENFATERSDFKDPQSVIKWLDALARIMERGRQSAAGL